ARSCDVYFYGLADVLGVDRIATFMAPFGFGKPTGIDIGGEKPGLLPSRQWKAKAFARAADRVWFPGETVNFGIGQGYLSVTPLQLAHYVSVIASRELQRSEEHTSELQSHLNLVCRLLLEKKK